MWEEVEGLDLFEHEAGFGEKGEVADLGGRVARDVDDPGGAEGDGAGVENEGFVEEVGGGVEIVVGGNDQSAFVGEAFEQVGELR